MTSVFNPILYNQFFKDLRKKHNLTTKELANKLYYSVGFINQLENSANLLENDKASILLTYYGYDENYLINFDNTFNDLMEQFMHNIYYIEDDVIEDTFNEIKIFFKNYQNSILFIGYTLCHLIFHIYGSHKERVKEDLILIDYRNYFSKKYQKICNTYLGRYFYSVKDYNKSRDYFKEASSNSYSDYNTDGLLNDFFSEYYMRVKDIPASFKYSDEAIRLFSKAHNDRRLINTNITISNQYLKMKDYPKAIQLNNETLKLIKEKNYLLENRNLLHNNAFIYMMQNKYHEAVKCYEKIADETMREKCYSAYMMCLAEINALEKAKEICLKGKKIATTPYYIYLNNIYFEYFENINLDKLTNGLIKALKLFDNYLDQFDKEYLHVLIAYHYKKQKKYKKSAEYLEKLKDLDY